MQKGKIEILIILILLLTAFFLVGGFSTKRNDTSGDTFVYHCCDSGDGAECRSSNTKTLTYNGELYGLLKSNVRLTEGGQHIKPAPLAVSGADGPLFVNDSQGFGGACPTDPAFDQIFVAGATPDCVLIPDEILVYVCKQNCDVASIQNGTAVFDAYFRMSRGETVPSPIANCIKPDPSQIERETVIVEPTPVSKDSINLQALIQKTIVKVPWVSPHCKPAIYLYPKQQENILVTIAPKGKLTLTIPPYPSDGWRVVANPDGLIAYDNLSYDYLYYESEIPDDLIDVPEEGFVVKSDELAGLFDNILPKLGLNEKEKRQFSEYWLKALPKSAYYFVGIVSTKNLNAFSPITISPKPDTIVRVTLYFKPLEEPMSVESPTIHPVTRRGFTVIEWGGIVKTDPLNPFSCLM